MPNNQPSPNTPADQARLGADALSPGPLEDLARQLAESHIVSCHPRRSSPLLDHLQEQEALLRDAYHRFASDPQLSLSFAGEWLLDNFYLVQQALRQVREDMPEGFYRQLPQVQTHSPENCPPRIYMVAREIIRYSKNYIVFDQVRHFIHTYQGITPLTMGELWALPTMLRFGVLENLTQAVAHITGLQTLDSEGIFAVAAPTLQELTEERTVSNCILSLRGLAAQNWKTFFESVSRVEQVLRRDPANVYAAMDFDTRDSYRKVIEELALATGWDEEKVAQEAIQATQAGTQDSPRTQHVGFYLLGAGRLQLEAHLGYHPPLSTRLQRWLFSHPTLVYLGSIALITLAILLSEVWYAMTARGTPLQLLGVVLITLVPATAVAVSLVNWIITYRIPPRILPRMAFEDGIPAHCRTMVVIPALLTHPEEVKDLLWQLELYFQSNADPNLYYAVLSDFADAPRRDMPGDEDLIEQAIAGIQALNEKYGTHSGGPFYFFHRERAWNPAEEHWMGWERKRGKLADLNKLLMGDVPTYFSVQLGDLEFLPQIKYVITLDADTVLPWGGARRLVATLAHPLNRAEFDPESGAVVTGYTVLQPRLEIWPTSANQSLFTRVFAGDTGLDLYTRAVSDVYQDLFGEGIYAGKGIYDVAAFERSLARRVPENALLSHDLFEGIHGRAGLCTDVTLFEDYPSHYLAYALRQHRWIRGDWQLLPWLLPRVPGAGGKTIPNDLSIMGRWKILDNLRRSLLTPTLLALLVAGWAWLPGSTLVWMLIGMLTLAMPLLTGIAAQLARSLRGASLSVIVQSAREGATRWLLALAFLAYETFLVLDAIGCTLVRLFITHKHLLQWTTTAHTIRLFRRKRKLALTWRQMSGAPFLALGIAVLVGWMRPAALPVAAPLLVLWLASPQIAHWISQPMVQEQIPLSAEQRQRLRCLARRTWLYFEHFVGPDDHWLPPDHYQQEPRGLLARRTSPTNIGMLLLSTLAAYDLGYIGPMDLVLRLRTTFESMDKLERYRGHFLNWYDTRNLKPLPPRYVSTVDSGNLAGCLLALRQGCLALPHEPVLRWQSWQGLLDTLDVLAEIVQGLEGVGVEKAVAPLEAHLAHIHQQVSALRDDPAGWPPLLAELSEGGWQEFDRLLMSLVESGSRVLDAALLGDLQIWSERVYHHLLSMQNELDMLLPWLRPLSQPPALFTQAETDPAITDAWQTLQDALHATPRLDEVPEVCKAGRARLDQLQGLLAHGAGPADQARPAPECSRGKLFEQVQEARAWCMRLAEGLDSARMAAESLLIGLQDVSAQAQAYFEAMDFGFLFDARRQVFHIGYNVTAEIMDRNYYDLLASEARLASFLAIAKGDVPQSHWLHLSRPFTRINGARALLSWSATMFEYLMPPLLMRSYEGTLMHQTSGAVVDRQIAYGHQRHVPWGISESGYYLFDADMNYQYRAFGVPGLGFKRGLEQDLVISPYASLLALPLRPRAVVQNIADLMKQQMLGRYGFFEAIDYTPSRLPSGQESAIVRSYMAHHQGMIFVSMLNYLQDEVMVDRFHADPRAQSAELLLYEQVPQQVPIEYPHPEETGPARPLQTLPIVAPWQVPMRAALPQVHYLSNGRYSVLITSDGTGYSQWQEMDLTRWRADTSLDMWGTWVYLQDRESGALWSAAYQPTAVTPQSQEVLFYTYKAEIRRKDHDISLRMEVTVSPDDDVEIRRITLTNGSNRPRRLTLTSYGEVVLASRIADRRHPAFNKLFVESEYLPKLNALLFHRRPRSADEKPVYMAHLLVIRERQEQEVTGAHESERTRLLGRGQTLRSPAALRKDGHGLSGTTGATLDPIMAIGQDIDLKPHATVQVAYITLVAASREEALALAHYYQAWIRIRQAFGRAHDYSRQELRELDLGTAELERIQKLLSVLLYPHAALRAAPATLAANVKGQPGLWAYGISGDYPILLVRFGSQEETSLIQALLQAHTYWRNRQVKIDLVIVNQRETGYSQDLQSQLHRLIARTGSEGWLNRRGGIFLLRADQMSEADQVLVETAARAILDGEKDSLAEQLRGLQEQPTRLPSFVPTLLSPEDIEPTPPLIRPTDLLFDNGLGGFSADGREYVIYLERCPEPVEGPGQWTPAPWINVIANPHFGFLVSEAGAGYTWAENSGENRLTTWRNDPVADAPGEALYLRDEETAQVWSPTPLPTPAPAPYLIRHGAGYSVFEHSSHGLKQRLRLFAVPDAPAKVVQLRLENTWNRTRRITATFYAEWVLGTTRDANQQYIIPEYEANSRALLARNPYNEEFGERVAFLAVSKEPHSLTADRTEFLGRGGSLGHPAALERIGLAGTVKAGLDPCAALQIHLDLPPGGVREIFFLLGQGADRQETLRLVKQYQDPAQVEATWEDVTKFWDGLLGSVTVRTPDSAMNLLLNRWLLYQTLSCRVWGRSALYQSSGAFGYRDQLQDVMAVVHTAPDVVRDHILQAARHQFEVGDVLHWWHPPSGRGVRTRYSDDLLWLPFVTAHYMAATGDDSILTEKVPFLSGAPLEQEEVERYGHYETTAKVHTLYEHCRRALEKGTTAGPHGLPLMGGGDWNDGMNRVGIKGRGESVWLGWFLYATLTRFAPLCEGMGDDEQAAAYRQQAHDLLQALEANAWDGNWYRRAYYDDGTPLGSAENDECQIDSIAQSWAVLSGAADPARTAQAMEAVADRLVRRDDQLVLLFTPPFDKTSRDPGYIKGYVPGIRENGGQYTHAALWTVWAFTELGHGDRAEALFRLLNPIYYSDTPEKVIHYRVEPYVVAADVYSVPPHVGRGGWTWYTGSAGWMYRLGLEAILGLRRVGNVLRMDPCIPKDWSGYELTYRDGETSYQIRVENPDGVNRGVKQVTLDGEPLSGGDIPLLGDGRDHRVRVLMG